MRKYFDRLTFEKVVSYLQEGQMPMLRFYLSSGLDLTDLNHSDASALVISWGLNPSLEALTLLLNSGVDANAQDKHGNGFFIYAGLQHEDLRDIVNFLLERGADINLPNYYGETALIHSFRVGALSKARILLMNNADVNKKDSRGITALMYAATLRRSNIMHWLISAGADVNEKDANGHTALLWTDGNLDSARPLLDAGVAVNTVDEKGDTTLMVALDSFRLGGLEIIKLLVEKGADVNAVNAQQPDKTVLSTCFKKCLFMSRLFIHFVKEEYPQKYLHFLLEQGANPSLPTIKHSLMHRTVIDNYLHLIPYFMSCGVAPYKAKVIGARGFSMYSQFYLAVISNNVELAKYFVDNWYLTPQDVNTLYRGPAVLKGLKQCCLSSFKDTKNMLKETSQKPLSLMTLSFIKTSSLIGSTADRRKKVESLGLPALIKKKLLFESLVGKLTADKKVKRCTCIDRADDVNSPWLVQLAAQIPDHFYEEHILNGPTPVLPFNDLLCCDS